MKSNTDLKKYKSLSLFLLVLVLINPFAVFILTKDFVITVFLPLTSLVIIAVFNSNNKFKILLFIFLNILLVLFFFINAELVFRTCFPDYKIENLYRSEKKYYFNRSYLDKTFTDKEFRVNYKTNKQGFRISVEDDQEASVNQTDWLFLGDSYTQGAQVQFEDLYTEILQAYFPQKIITNAGISGFGIADELNFYKSEGKNLKATKVFLQICNFNDFMNVNERESTFIDYLMEHSDFARYILYGFRYANPTELPLGRWTEPFYSTHELNKEYNVFYKESSKKKDIDLKRFKYYLGEFKKSVEKNGGELIVIQIPTKEQVYYKYFADVLNAFKIAPSALNMSFPDQYLSGLCKVLNIKHINLYEDFQAATEPVFYDFDEHLNIVGHQTLALRLKKELQRDSTPEISRISTFNVYDRYPNIHGENSLLTYQSLRDGNMELFVSDTSLSNAKRLTYNNIDESHPCISVDGNSIVFTEGDPAENETKVVMMRVDGSERRYLTSQKNQYGAIPFFNRAGDKICYAEWTGERKIYTNPVIVVYEPNTGKKIICTTDRFESWRPIFSSDGNRLIYISKRNKKFDIYEYDLKKRSEKRLINTSFDKWDPCISNNGKLMAFAGKTQGNWNLFLYNYIKNEIRQITFGTGNEWDPCFSANSKTLYFAAESGMKNGIFKIDISNF